ALVCWVLVCAVTLAAACRKDEPRRESPPALTTSSPDRLAPGAQLPGTEAMFCITVPRGLKLNYHYVDVAQARGSVPLANLAEYFRKHVSVAAIEMSESRATFPRAYINGDTKKRVFRIEIIHHHGQSTVKISDIT